MPSLSTATMGHDSGVFWPFVEPLQQATPTQSDYFIGNCL